jgi:hypothetical protein
MYFTALPEALITSSPPIPQAFRTRAKPLWEFGRAGVLEVIDDFDGESCSTSRAPTNSICLQAATSKD